MSSTSLRLEGRPLAQRLAEQVQARIASAGRPVVHALFRVGTDPGTETYQRMIVKTGKKLGIDVRAIDLPDGTSLARVQERVREEQADPTVAGLQILKPLPPGIDPARLLEVVDPTKDAEALHPANLGALLLDRPKLVPCTPASVMELLKGYEIPISGRRALVIGRSESVGKPVALLLLAQNATVTIAHSRSRDLSALAREAEILVVAVGRPNLVQPDWIRPGAVVIDVGHHVLPDGSTAGDVAAGVEAIASAWTPVPGGVGPLTVSLLLANVATAAGV